MCFSSTFSSFKNMPFFGVSLCGYGEFEIDLTCALYNFAQHSSFLVLFYVPNSMLSLPFVAVLVTSDFCFYSFVFHSVVCFEIICQMRFDVFEYCYKLQLKCIGERLVKKEIFNFLILLNCKYKN